MPTGYTSDIKNGITFKQFIMGCARAFGALIEMREEPMTATIPDKFSESKYYDEKLLDANADLSRIQSMTKEECEQVSLDAHRIQVTSNNKHIQEHLDLQKKYEAMLAEVHKWIPPSKDHTELKEFMIKQIEESIKFDCNIEYYKKPVKLLNGIEWKEQRMKSIVHDIEYYQEEKVKETDRIYGRNKWLLQLRESLQ
jgi:hypothetical protein